MNNHNVSLKAGGMSITNCCFIVDPDAPDVAACEICQAVRARIANRNADEWPDIVLEDALDAEFVE